MSETKQTESEEVLSPQERIVQWAKQLEEYDAVAWDRLPEIDLYMDQVLTYMDRMLPLFQPAGNGRLLTSSMINNYVKDNLLPRPDHKKYSREHLTQLMMICMLKQVLSIPNISALFKDLLADHPTNQLYDEFCGIQKSACKEVCSQVEATAPQGKNALLRLAFTLSIEANARRIAAERILYELRQEKKE